MEDFPLAPPLYGEWVTMDDETSALLGERLRDFDAVALSEPVGAIRSLQPPCYPGHVLCDVVTGKRERRIFSFLYGPDGVRRLNGQSEVIHDLNRSSALDLSDDSLEEFYLRFFCFFVHGAEGPFEIITSPDMLAPGAYDADMIVPPIKDDDSGFWQAIVLYGRALFKAEFNMAKDGNVKMESDDVIAEEVRRVPEILFDGAFRQPRPEDE